MDMRQFTAGEYLKKEDVTYQGTDVKMLGVKVIKIKDDEHPLLGLEGMKPLVLNKVNIRVISKLYGDLSENWVGKTINVYHDPTVVMAGQIVGGVRVKPSTDWNPDMSTPQASPEARERPRANNPSPEAEYVPGADDGDWG